jgi:flagellin FlaB
MGRYVKNLLVALRSLCQGQRGMTGLETAIIIIAFSTVASVLAYSVLSAGIFSAERGKATVYQGLDSAQATIEVKGSVLGLSTDNNSVSTVQFELGLTIPDQKVDTNAILVNYFDTQVHSENVTLTFTKNGSSTERGSASMLENDEVFTANVTIPATATLGVYDTFTVQMIPPTGATITIERTIPGSITPVMDLR